MPISLSRSLPRYKGTTKKLDFPERPKCKYCKRSMKIVKTTKPKPMVGLHENYHVQNVYYQCGQALCKGGDEPYTTPENTINPPKSHYDYEVYAKVCHLRWKNKLTYEEIVTEMEDSFGILINHSMIEKILKIYEIACSNKYKPEYIKKIKKNGGVLLTIDGMKPLKGNLGLYTTCDYSTGLTIHSKRLESESTIKITEFLTIAKNRIEKELGVLVIGIISDALPAQRKAIEKVFLGVPHCLCHYHFYNLVFKAPKQLDNSLMTQTRKYLRKLYYLNKTKLYANQGKFWEPEYSFTKEILEALRSLSNWKNRPKDPYFVGLELFSRLNDIYLILNQCIEDLDTYEGDFKDKNIIQGLFLKLKELIESNTDAIRELETIRSYLAEIKTILDKNDNSAEEALKELESYCKTLGELCSRKNCGLIETEFIEDLSKFVETKGPQLFNYKRIEGAPRTNNSHELTFKQLKHFLRRVIGFQAAKHYLLSHGERIVFIMPKEAFKGILEILKSIDHHEARKLIESERVSRNSIRIIIHDPNKWVSKLEDFKKKWIELLEWINVRN